MRFDIHLHIHTQAEAPPWAVELRDLINCNQEKIMATLDELAASVQSETSVVDGITTLLADIKSKLDAALSGTTLPPAVQAKVDEIFAANEAQKQKLADAIVANTPSA